MLALVDGVPRTLNLAQALSHYIDHQIEVIRRRSQFRLDRARNRAHIVEGLLRAIDMLDAVIATIRASADRPEARTSLMAEPFSFTEVQATHILDMTLGRLTRLGRSELESEMEELRATIAELEAILSDDGKLRGVIESEMTAVRDKYSNPRRSIVTHDPGEMGVEDLIDDEEIVVTMTRAGYIKSVAAAAFRTQGRGGRGVQGARLKEEDLVSQVVHTSALAYLLLFSNQGKVYRLRGHEIPMKDRTARGTAAVNLVPLAPNESITAIIATREFAADQFLVSPPPGQVKKTAMSEYDKSRREGFIAINLREGDELVRVVATSGHDDLFEVTRSGMTIRFNEEDVRAMGRDAAGVRGIRLRAGDAVVSLRRGGRRHRHPDRDRCRVREAHEARAVQPPDAWRTGRARHPADRHPRQRGRGLHGRPRRGDPPGLLGWRRHPDPGPGDRLAGSRRDGRPRHEPRRGSDRRRRGWVTAEVDEG